jgi:hypothetical protein
LVTSNNPNGVSNRFWAERRNDRRHLKSSNELEVKPKSYFPAVGRLADCRRVAMVSHNGKRQISHQLGKSFPNFW